MEKLHGMIKQGSSYSEMVLWLQKRQGCSYLQASLLLNEELRRYRLQHGAEASIPRNKCTYMS